VLDSAVDNINNKFANLIQYKTKEQKKVTF